MPENLMSDQLVAYLMIADSFWTKRFDEGKVSDLLKPNK